LTLIVADRRDSPQGLTVSRSHSRLRQLRGAGRRGVKESTNQVSIRCLVISTSGCSGREPDPAIKPNAACASQILTAWVAQVVAAVSF
jgi:hypothetical protein